jgi:hypothetical protein
MRVFRCCSSHSFIKKLALCILFFSGGFLFAQVDYFFVLEKTGTGSVAVNVFQTVLISVIKPNDTVAAIAYTNGASMLFPPLPGNTPDLPKLALDALLADASKTVSSQAGLTAALVLADSQALAWQRPGVERRLVIISGSALPAGKSQPSLKNLPVVYYTAVDGAPDPGLAALVNPANQWLIDSSLTPDTAAGAAALTLEDGIFAMVKAMAPNYERAKIGDDLISFTLGGLFWEEVTSARVLALNLSGDDVRLLKNGAEAPCEACSQGSYAVFTLQNPSGGKYLLENGKALLVIETRRISVVKLLIMAVVAVVIISLGLGSLIRGLRPDWTVVILENKEINALYYMFTNKTTKELIAYEEKDVPGYAGETKIDCGTTIGGLLAYSGISKEKVSDLFNWKLCFESKVDEDGKKGKKTFMIKKMTDSGKTTLDDIEDGKLLIFSSFKPPVDKYRIHFIKGFHKSKKVETIIEDRL